MSFFSFSDGKIPKVLHAKLIVNVDYSKVRISKAEGSVREHIQNFLNLETNDDTRLCLQSFDFIIL